MNIVVGIDGGGTKTRVLCRDLSGNTVGEKDFSALNINGIRGEVFEVLTYDIIKYIKGFGDCRALCLGCAGLSNKDLEKRLETSFRAQQITNYKIVGDQEIAHYGALAGKEGIVVIAGTGSIAYGRRNDGREARLGGWGHIIGDEGSGYALGRDALNLISKEIDGYGDRTCLREILASQVGLRTREDIVAYVYKNDKSAVAKLAPFVDIAARDGDEPAKKIIEKHARALEDLLLGVYDKLEFKKAYFSCLGGMLENDTILKREFLAMVERYYPFFTYVPAINNASVGAVMIAEKMI